MAGGLFARVKRWIEREDLRTDDLNAEFDNIISNLKPDKVDDYSLTVSQMRQTFDPGNIGTENQPQSLAEELEALRFQLNSVVGRTYWYEPPSISLEELNDVVSAGLAVQNNRIVSGRVDANSQPMFLVPNGAAATAVLEGAPTALTCYINGSLVEFVADQSITGLQTAPAANNTCLVNDATLVGQQSSKTQGERGTVITIDTIGANITALNGQYAAFLKGSEIFLAEVDTTNNRLKNCFRGFAFDSTGTWLARETLSDNATITLLKAAWIFATFNASTPGFDVTYNKPIASGSQPGSPSIGDYWYDTSAEQWKKYNGSSFVAQEAIFVGVAVQNTTACIGARSLDFSKTFSELNSLEAEYVSTATVRANRIGSKVSVYGESLYFEYSQPIWSTATDLDTGESLTPSTTYWAYLKPSGAVTLSSVAPSERKFDLLGGYHPAKPYRSVAEFVTDGGSLITSTSVSIAEHHQRVLPDRFVSSSKVGLQAIETANIKDLNVTRPKMVAVGEQLSAALTAYTITNVESDVTNLTVTITTTGRPVMLMLQNSSVTGAGNEGQLDLQINFNGTLLFRRDATNIAAYSLNGNTTQEKLPVSAFSFLDTSLAAGTYTYKLRAVDANSTSSVIRFTRLVAYEL